MNDSQNAQSLTCSARIRLQADTVSQARNPCYTPGPLPEGENGRIRCRELRKDQ